MSISGNSDHDSDFPPPPPPQPEFASDGLADLVTDEEEDLLDKIDKLRSLGISGIVDLPQLVVCGDQSSGKSSVLEAVTEIPFPRRANLCTRFATEIVLRRDAKESATVKITPGPGRSEEEKKKLEQFSATISHFSEFPDLIDKAAEVMGVGGSEGASAFSLDILRLTLTGPNKPNLTIVDTPGLIHAATKHQSKTDITLVSDLVSSHLRQPSTIILAVISARNDIANQVIIEHARQFDPDGTRTLGIITKPDCADREMTKDFVKLARNEDVVFDLGWHVLRNRSTEELEADGGFEERNRVEEEFLAGGAWREVESGSKGVENLRVRLSKLLFRHVKKELPRVRKQLQEALEGRMKELEGLGRPRGTVEQQREFLIGIGEGLRARVEAAAGGNYLGGFFQTRFSEDGAGGEEMLMRRLQAVVQRENDGFAKRMRRFGHSREICEDPEKRETEFLAEEKENPASSPEEDAASSSPPAKPTFLTRAQAIQWVLPFVTHSRGRELAGSYNPLLISDIFWAQSSPWYSLARQHIMHVFHLAHFLVASALDDIASPEIANKIWEHHLDGVLNARLSAALNELDLLLSDQKRHPITYNPAYTTAVAASNKPRQRDLDAMKRSLGAVLGVPKEGEATISADVYWNATPVVVVGGDSVAESEAQKERDDFACEDILDRMLAYYQVALENFVDNVAMQVVDRRILDKLEGVFSPAVVAGMKDDVLKVMAGERSRDVKKRERLELTVKSLKEGNEVFGRVILRRA